MPIVVVTQPSDGTTADAADVNSQINAILAVLNGFVDQDNLKDGGVTNSKLAGGITIDKLAGNVGAAWVPLTPTTPNTITYNGNRNYSLVFNTTDLTSIISQGMKLKLPRTVTAPTQCTSLNGSNQYYSKTSPAGMTFTNNFTVSAWIKLSSYANGVIASRYNGTSGWDFLVNSNGQIILRGFNAGAGNARFVNSAASVPLNKWVHVTAQLDMSTFTNTATTCYVMIDDVDVTTAFAAGTVTSSSGTNPTALIQAGNLEIGGENGGTSPFPGKIAQVAIYNAKVTQATIQASAGQTLAGTETSLISAYSFNNSINDLNANANNLTANNAAVATNADSPFAGGSTAKGGFVAGTTEFAEVFDVTFSTNTTVVVQVPDGYMIPTSGGLSNVAYASAGAPLGWPGDIKTLAYIPLLVSSAASTTGATQQQIAGLLASVYVPTGRKIDVELDTGVGVSSSGAAGTIHDISICLTSAADANRLRQQNITMPGAAASSTAAVAKLADYYPATNSITLVGAYAGSSTQTMQVNGATLAPAFLRVVLVK